jgi:hypothetical protein
VGCGAALLVLPLLLTDLQGQPVPAPATMPSCFVSGPELWHEAGGRSLLCAPTASAAAVHLGDACWRVYVHPVTFTPSPDGSVMARFDLADGATSGALPAPASPGRDAYVADARLGSDEPATTGGLQCRLASTFHFYCPADRTLDRVCLTWQDADRAGGGVRVAPVSGTRRRRPGRAPDEPGRGP